MKTNLIYRDDLLSGLVNIFNELEEKEHKICLGNYEVGFCDSNGVELLKCSPARAVDYIVNDLYFGQDGDWSQARHLTLKAL